MARTKDVVLAPEQKELMEKEYLDFVKPSTYGNKANPSSCNSLYDDYDDVENPELRAIVEKVAATTPYREETSTNEAQSPPNPQKRISGKQRKATLEEYQQTSSKFQGLTTASQSSSVPMYETVLIVSSASLEGGA